MAQSCRFPRRNDLVGFSACFFRVDGSGDLTHEVVILTASSSVTRSSRRSIKLRGAGRRMRPHLPCLLQRAVVREVGGDADARKVWLQTCVVMPASARRPAFFFLMITSARCF